MPLSEETLRPGTVYADPYGHVLVLARRISQSDDEAGIIIAVGAQPGPLRESASGAAISCSRRIHPGLKRFRPIVREKNGILRRLTNAEIAKDPQ